MYLIWWGIQSINPMEFYSTKVYTCIAHSEMHLFITSMYSKNPLILNEALPGTAKLLKTLAWWTSSENADIEGPTHSDRWHCYLKLNYNFSIFLNATSVRNNFTGDKWPHRLLSPPAVSNITLPSLVPSIANYTTALSQIKKLAHSGSWQSP